MRAFTNFSGWLLATVLLLAARAPASHAAPMESAGSAAPVERWSALADEIFEHIARDNDLPNSTSPTALAEDGQGFLWIGTQNGLARWDGYHFRSFKADPGVAGTLPDNVVTQLKTDTRGRLWVATNSGGLARYDADRDRFVVYSAGPDALSSASLRDITDDGNGGVWVGTDAGLDHVHAETGTVEHLRREAGNPDSLPDNRIRALFLDRDGVLWVGTASGLVRRDPVTGRFAPLALGSALHKTAVAWSFYQDSAARVWIGTVREGAYVYTPSDRAIRPVLDSPPSSLSSEGVHAITETRPGEVWLGTDGHGIVVVDTKTWQTKRIRHDPTVSSSIADDSIQALLTDRSGLVWLCTNRGISHYDARQTAVLTVFGGSSESRGLTDPDVDSVLPMPDGRVWLGLGSNGIDVLDPRGLRVAALRPDADHPATALPRDYVNALARAPAGDVYIGTEQGLYRADRLARAVARVALPGEDLTAAVWALYFAQDRLWVGGFDGLWSVDLAGGKALRTTHVTGLTDERVTAIEGDAQGALWIGTKHGLNRLDAAGHVSERILPDPANPAALRAGYVATLLTDGRGRLWVGTLGGGISVLDRREPDGKSHFVRLGTAQGLANENVDKLLEDPQGQVWASTDDGLAVIDPHTFAIRSLRRAEGVPIANHWAGAGAATEAGELLFGAVGGLVVVRPTSLAFWSYRPPVVVTDVRVGGKHVPPGNTTGGPDALPLIVPPDANSIAVEFAALDYSAPQRNRYEFRLDGFDPNWVETDPSHRVAAYTNLPPGSYSLHLRGSNRDGVWNEAALIVPIRVLPAWYQTVGFRILVGSLFAALIAAFVQGRTLYLRRARRELERQVVARTAQLRESQRQLEQIAYYDTLTALPNRRMFMEEFRELLVLAGLQRGSFAVLLIDLDRLKHINDTLGHDVGDALLIEAAIRLQAAVRKSDCVARLGGDEYAVLLTHNPAAADIEAVCQRIVAGFEREILVNGAGLRTSPSIGVAVYPDHGMSQDQLYKSADIALYEAKRSGGNTWRWFRGRSSRTGAEQTSP